MFRFAIRDVLWLMVVVAMALGWWMHDRQRVATMQRYRGVAVALELLLTANSWTIKFSESRQHLLVTAPGGGESSLYIHPNPPFHSLIQAEIEGSP